MEEKKIRRHKQIAAIIGIVLLVAMYLTTLILAVCRFRDSFRLFMASLACTVFVPILIWIYIWLYGMLTRQKTIATFFPDAPSEEEVLEARIAAQQEASGEQAQQEAGTQPEDAVASLESPTQDDDPDIDTDTDTDDAESGGADDDM